MDFSYEALSPGVFAAVTKQHRFGVDAVLLARFSRPGRRDFAADLCSGCGVIPLLWFSEGPGPEHADAVELMPEAAELIRLGIAKSGLTGRLSAVEADLRDLSGVLPAGKYDLIACNPPYQAKGAANQSPDPARNAARHEVSCSIGDVCAAAGRLLRFGGRLCICHRPERLLDAAAAMRANKIEPKRLRLVQHAAGKTPFLLLWEGRLGGKPGLSAEPALLLEGPEADADGPLQNFHIERGR